MIFDDGKTVEFIFEGKKNQYVVSLTKFKRDLIEPFADFYIKSLIIDEPSRKIEARITLYK